MKDEERDLLRKTILGLCSQPVHYTKLEKRVVATCQPWATSNTFKSQLHYLLSNGYVERVSRGAYKVTSKGEKLLEILT